MSVVHPIPGRGVRGRETWRKRIVMDRKIVVALALLALAGATPLLSACHTTAGAGEDISATGQAIDRAAKKATP